MVKRCAALLLLIVAAQFAFGQQVGTWVDPDKSEPAGTRYGTFQSRTIGEPVSYLLYLPEGYESEPKRRYPVVYWLHGLGGNQRSGTMFLSLLAGAMKEGTVPEMIVVLVNGLRGSMYTDSKDGQRPVETVIVRDLIPHVDATYRTIAERRGRAIEGYSMGGFGAARLGFKYPDLFGAVSVMAGALHTEDTIAERRAEIFEKVYGGDKDYYRAHSPWTLLEQNAGRLRGRLIRIGVGDQDRLLAWNQDLHQKMLALNVENEFIVVEGVGHNGREFYRRLGERVWSFYSKAFGATGAAATGNP